ncbi:MAG: hypothetical protein AB1563_13335, partial [Bacillota bacterium]
MKEGSGRPSKPVAERDRGEAGAGAGRAREASALTGRNSVIEALRSGRPLTKIMIAKGVEPGFAATVKSLAREA